MDETRKKTDKKLSAMENELTKIYQKSAKNIYTKWNKYMTRAAERLKSLQDEYEQAKLSDDKDLIKETGKKLGQAKRNVTIFSQQYKEMLDETSRQLSLVNQTAVAYINKQIPDIYALNYNSISGDAFKAGIKMGLVDAHTVKRLIENGKIPQKKISEEKDIRWNKKQINSAVLQGILQGDSIPKISSRIFKQITSDKDTPDIISKNRNSAVRIARTMVTGAECQGRIDSYHELESRGVVLKKVWIATPDSRTRETHLELDGEEVDIDEEFSNGLMFPGDESGDPSEYYNCRCSIRTHIIGFRHDDGSISEIDFEREETLHDRQMEEERERREANGTGFMGVTAEGYSDDQTEEMIRMIKNDGESGEIYEKYADQLEAPVPEKGSKAFYRHSDKRVHFDPQANIEDDIHVKFETHFHEYGHNIDYLMGDGETAMSVLYRDKQGRSFEQIITGEWQKCLNADAMWVNFESNLDMNVGGMGLRQWLESNLIEWRKEKGLSRGDPTFATLWERQKGLQTVDEARVFIKENIDIFAGKEYNIDRRTIDKFCDKIKSEYELQERGSLSDMFERFSVDHGGPDYPFGVGHGAGYTKWEGSLAKETFAEMFSAEITHPASLDVIKKYLPESYKTFKDMTKEIMLR